MVLVLVVDISMMVHSWTGVSCGYDCRYDGGGYEDISYTLSLLVIVHGTGTYCRYDGVMGDAHGTRAYCRYGGCDGIVLMEMVLYGGGFQG